MSEQIPLEGVIEPRRASFDLPEPFTWRAWSGNRYAFPRVGSGINRPRVEVLLRIFGHLDDAAPSNWREYIAPAMFVEVERDRMIVDYFLRFTRDLARLRGYVRNLEQAAEREGIARVIIGYNPHTRPGTETWPGK